MRFKVFGPCIALLLVFGGASVAWANSVDVSESARLAGKYGMAVIIDDTDHAYVQDDSPSAESRYRVRFYVRLTDLSIPVDEEFVHFAAFDNSDVSHLEVLIRRLAGESNPRVRLRTKNGGGWSYTGSVPLPRGWHAIEIDFAAELGGSNNGSVDWWINGEQQSGISGLDNESSMIDYVRWGAVGGIDSGTSGALQVDDFASYRTGDRIGLVEVHGVGLYDPGDGKFYLRHSRESGDADISFRYGKTSSGWSALRGDWNGDDRMTVGLFDPLKSKFLLKNTNSSGYADFAFRFGPAAGGWVPVVGDWDGDGVDTVGLYDPSGGKFYLMNTHDGGAADLSFRYGPTSSTWIPVAGDWDGDGTDSVGLYAPGSGKFYLKDTNSGGNADYTFRYGPTSSGWVPLTGDWNADGHDGIGLFDKVGGKIYLREFFEPQPPGSSVYVGGGPADFEFRYGPKNTSWDLVGGFWLLP
jgi:hypothetical protein